MGVWCMGVWYVEWCDVFCVGVWCVWGGVVFSVEVPLQSPCAQIITGFPSFMAEMVLHVSVTFKPALDCLNLHVGEV